MRGEHSTPSDNKEDGSTSTPYASLMLTSSAEFHEGLQGHVTPTKFTKMVRFSDWLHYFFVEYLKKLKFVIQQLIVVLTYYYLFVDLSLFI